MILFVFLVAFGKFKNSDRSPVLKKSTLAGWQKGGICGNVNEMF